jgi:gamma-polyglutamate synthase
VLVLVLTCSLLLFYFVELKIHNRYLNQIPTRILVTGSRGKSSIVRLIYAGVSNYKKAMAKTTGSCTVLIDEHGTEIPLLRNGTATVLEQIKIIRKAAKANVDVLIVESMALRPELQKVESSKLIRPTIHVLSNIRPDHVDVMGKNKSEISKSYLGSIYNNAQLITTQEILDKVGDKSFFPNLPTIARLDQIEIQQIKKRLNYIEHDENIELAFSTCQNLGIGTEEIIAGSKTSKPDAGALTTKQIKIDDKNIYFINAFAANDPDSIVKIWREQSSTIENKTRTITIINTRYDRQYRTAQLAELVGKEILTDSYIVTGNDIDLFLHHLDLDNLDGKVLTSYGFSPKKLLKKLKPLLQEQTVIFGIGNFADLGSKLKKVLEELD